MTIVYTYRVNKPLESFTFGYEYDCEIRLFGYNAVLIRYHVLTSYKSRSRRQNLRHYGVSTEWHKKMASTCKQRISYYRRTRRQI